MVLEGTLPWFSSIVDFLGVGLLDFNQLISRVDEFTILIALICSKTSTWSDPVRKKGHCQNMIHFFPHFS